jgi:excisionase family DNA binding protein
MSSETECRDVVTTREAADLLGVSVRSVQLWVEKGALKAWKTAGGHRRISLESVRRVLRERDVDVSRPIAPEGSEDLFTVLVVDDDPHMLRLQLHQLSRLGLPIRAIPAENGFLGLLQVGRRRPDLVLTDLLMPGMDGYRMVKAIKEHPEYRDTDVVVITGLSATEVLERGWLPEGVDVVQKPVPLARFEEIVRTSYARRQYRNQTARTERRPAVR